jgi:hypothetical protein
VDEYGGGNGGTTTPRLILARRNKALGRAFSKNFQGFSEILVLERDYCLLRSIHLSISNLSIRTDVPSLLTGRR